MGTRMVEAIEAAVYVDTSHENDRIRESGPTRNRRPMRICLSLTTRQVVKCGDSVRMRKPMDRIFPGVRSPVLFLEGVQSIHLTEPTEKSIPSATSMPSECRSREDFPHLPSPLYLEVTYHFPSP